MKNISFYQNFQLIVCKTRKNKGEIYFFDSNRLVFSTKCFIGKNGACLNRREGTLTTPKGLFPISLAFYQKEKPKCNLPLLKIKEGIYWIDDSKSKYYNYPVKHSHFADYKSFEDMQKIKEYMYGFVIDYNRFPTIKYRGSAIFFHIGESFTSGCIATKKEDLLHILSLLDKNKSPYILII